MPAPTEPMRSGGNRQGYEEGWELTTVVLEKSSARQGFGIAISGGKDNPHFKTGDVSIIVSDIVTGSPADGALRIGDKLVSVNERLVDGGTHHDAVQALKAAGMQARMQVKRPAPIPKGPPKEPFADRQHLQEPESSTPKGSPKGSDSERGRSNARKKPREMQQESTEKSKRSRSRSRNKEDGENGDKPRRSRSKNREEGENGEKKERRSRSKNREEGENGEKKERRSRSSHREDGENGEKKERRSRSSHREEGENGEKKERRSRSRAREGEGEDGEKKRSRSKSRDAGDGKERKSRGRSKSRSRDDLTRAKSKESLHRSKSKSRDVLAVPEIETVTVVLNRGAQGYGFSLGQEIFIKDFAKDSPAANADDLDKGDIVHEINGTKLENLKMSECIDIIRAATEQLTLTIVKKPKPVVTATDQADGKIKTSKPVRPSEAPEAEAKEKREKKPKAIEIPKEVDHYAHDESELESPLENEHYEERPREPSPPRSNHHNDTKDSWAAASPEKKRYDSNDSDAPVPPNQEVELIDTKVERLKAGAKKFERRLSEMPNARVISFHKTGSVGIQVAGGNSLGIFVAAIRPDSAAALEGLKPGDQIIMCNEIDFEDITREEAVLILLALPDDVSLIVESKKDTFDQIKKELGDNFFIRTNFDHMDKANPNELTFRKGEIFNVRDTMYQGLIGYWQAQRVGKNAQMLERGVLPNKSRAEQLAIAQKMEDRQATMPGRSKVKRKPSIGGTLKKQKFVSQDHLDESSFAEGVQIPAYERVVLKVADFMRPVVVLGALGDLIRLKLLEEMPDRFDLPTPPDVSGRNPSYEPYGASINLAEIRNVIAKNKHCLLDITPEGIEMLMYAQLCPIVILLKSSSRSAIKEMRNSLVSELRNSPTGIPGFDSDPLNAKQVKRVFSNAKKLEEFYPHIFTAKINTHIAGGDVLSREFYYKLKEIIFNQQAQSAWMPEEKPDEMLDDMVFHQPNYQSYMSGADSDTEGESTTSSPVLARKHYEEEDLSPLNSPTEEHAPPLSPSSEPEEDTKKHERSKDRGDRSRSRHKKDRDESTDRGHHRHRRDKSKDKSKSKRDEDDSPPKFKPEEPQSPTEEYRESPKPKPRHQKEEQVHQEYADDDYRSPPRNGYQDEYRQSPQPKSRSDREPPQDEYDDYREPPKHEYREPPRHDRDPPKQREDDSYRDVPRTYHKEEIPDPRDDHYYRGPPNVNREIQNTVEEHVTVPYNSSQQYREPEDYSYGRGAAHDEEDIPALRDPSYEMPKVLPDSPPSRRPPEVKSKPSVNAVKVFPSELKASMDEKRRSLKKIPDNGDPPSWSPPPHDDSPSLPPYRPPPPSNDEVPTKVLTLQERMNKFQHKVTTSTRPPPPAVPPGEEDAPPPARPAAPRNYIIDTRNRNGPRKDLYAENTYKPSAQFAEVTRVTPKPAQVEEPYMNLRNERPMETAPDSRYPGEDEPRVIATARGVFDHRGGLLESQETNVSIYIPAGALPEGRKQEVYFKVCQDSKYMPPLDSNSGETLLSPLVMCGPHGLKFRKPIELRLPHKGASNDSMAFSLKSSDSPVGKSAGHPGQWKNVKLGGKDLDSGRAYQVTDDTVSVLVDHF